MPAFLRVALIAAALLFIHACEGLPAHVLEARKPNVTPPKFLKPDGDEKAPTAPTVVVFIHGIFGDTIGTWKGSAGSLVDLVLDRPEFKGKFDAFAFGFPSSVLADGSFKIPEAAARLNRQLTFRRIPQKYKRIVIVAHSMGGLVALEALTTFPALRAQVPLVVAFGTPWDGSQVATLGNRILDNAALASMIPVDNNNSFLTSLGNRWKQAKEDGSSKTNVVCAYEKVSIPPIGLIVPESTGTKLCDGVADAIGDDHIGLIKPNSIDHDSIVTLTTALASLSDIAPNIASKPTFVPLEYVDKKYAESGMKACPPGFAVSGFNVGSNFVLCRRVPVPPEEKQLTTITDGGTQRKGMHACPIGTYVRGYNDGENQLLCSQDSRQIGLPKGEFEDSTTQQDGMHICPQKSEGTITVMTGINAGQNRFLCATISPE